MVVRPASPFPAETRLQVVGILLVALWLLAVVAGPALASSLGLSLNPNGHSHLYPHGHPFVDARVLWGVPNALDVLSNLPLAVAGLCGGWAMARHRTAAQVRPALCLFFSGLVLTALGSAWYHWLPDPVGLMWDRLGMGVTFAGALALAVAERARYQNALIALCVALPMALTSAVLPLVPGNVLPWAVVQFGGMALFVWLALQPAVASAMGVRLGLLVALYAFAKLLEIGDGAVFHGTGGLVSGHSLKHVVAALTAWPVIQAMRQNARAAGLTRVAASQQHNIWRRPA